MFSVLKSQIWSRLIWDWHHSLSNKTSEQKNPSCHNMPKEPGFIQHRKLGLTSCSPCVLNTEAKVDMRAEEFQSTGRQKGLMTLLKALSFWSWGDECIVFSLRNLNWTCSPAATFCPLTAGASCQAEADSSQSESCELTTSFHVTTCFSSRPNLRAPKEGVRRCSCGDKTATFRWRRLLGNNQEQTVQEGINEW